MRKMTKLARRQDIVGGGAAAVVAAARGGDTSVAVDVSGTSDDGTRYQRVHRHDYDYDHAHGVLLRLRHQDLKVQTTCPRIRV